MKWYCEAVMFLFLIMFQTFLSVEEIWQPRRSAIKNSNSSKPSCVFLIEFSCLLSYTFVFYGFSFLGEQERRSTGWLHSWRQNNFCRCVLCETKTSQTGHSVLIRDICLAHDNVRPFLSALLDSWEWDVLNHLPHSPRIASTDFMFLHVWPEKTFDDDDAVKDDAGHGSMVCG